MLRRTRQANLQPESLLSETRSSASSGVQLKLKTFPLSMRNLPFLGLLLVLQPQIQARSTVAEPNSKDYLGNGVAAPEGLKPIARFVLVEGKLWAEVYSHTLDTVEGPLPCWTYATVGMRSANQKEMLLTVKREKGEPETAFDRFLPSLFTSFYQFAQKGQCVDVGSYTQLGHGGTPILDRPDFLGLIYTAPQPLQDIEVTADHLAVILVTERELKLGLSLGMTRLFSRLGEASRYYPVPPWADRNRPEVYAPDTEELKSLLAKMPGITIPGVRVRIDNEGKALNDSKKVAPPPGGGMMVKLPSGRVLLTVTPQAAPRLKKAISESKTPDMLCLHAEMDSDADACLVWKAGESKPMAISKPGSLGERVAGNYLLLLGGQASNEMKGIEDGFSFLLTPKDWTRIREALSSGQSITLPGNDSMPTLVLNWAK